MLEANILFGQPHLTKAFFPQLYCELPGLEEPEQYTIQY